MPSKKNISSNQTLSKAKDAKQDEFYTQLDDISHELRHYKKYFQHKVVLCNCDDPFESNFFKYFALNFKALGLKKLIATCYSRSPIAGQTLPLFEIEGLKPEGKESHAIEINEVPDGNQDGAIDLSDVEYLLRHDANVAKPLKGDPGKYASGDFRSSECVALLKEADIVVTNPPFSLFREYVAQLIEHKKKFLIVGSKNAITYKEIFPLIMENKIWMGNGFSAGNAYFKIPPQTARSFATGVYDAESGLVKFRNVGWFTNMDHKKRHETMQLFRKYSPDEYQEYDNYNAINISKVADIPIDYEKIMGVPITFLDKYNPDQFEILGITKTWFGMASKKYPVQIQVSSNGKESEVSKLNDGPSLKISSPPSSGTYYRIGDDLFIQTYQRILIKRKLKS